MNFHFQIIVKHLNQAQLAGVVLQSKSFILTKHQSLAKNRIPGYVQTEVQDLILYRNVNQLAFMLEFSKKFNQIYVFISNLKIAGIRFFFRNILKFLISVAAIDS